MNIGSPLRRGSLDEASDGLLVGVALGYWIKPKRSLLMHPIVMSQHLKVARTGIARDFEDEGEYTDGEEEGEGC